MAEIATPAARLERAYQLWSESRAGRCDQFLALVADSIDMRSVLAPELPDDLAAVRSTREEVEQYFETIARDWEMVSFEVDRIVDGGDDVVMVGRCAWRNRATGKVIDTPKVDVWRFEDGRAISYLEMFDSLGFMQAVPAAQSPLP